MITTATHVLVTGGTGFVGFALLKELDKKNVDISVVVRGKNSNCEDVLSEIKNIKNIYYTDDIFNETTAWWKSIYKEIDAVVHLAWVATPGEYLESPKNLECLTGSLKMANALLGTKVTRYVGIGSCFEYDLTKQYLSNSTELGPESLYAATKAALYLVLNQIFPANGINFAWARLFYLYGDGEHPKRLHPYIKNCVKLSRKIQLRNGEKIRDYLEISKAASELAELALGTTEGAVNICSGRGQKIKDIALGIASELGRPDLVDLEFVGIADSEPEIIVGKRQ